MVKTPAAGAETSTATLSVSISTSSSSLATVSPDFFSQVPIEPSATLSPIVGTAMSMPAPPEAAGAAAGAAAAAGAGAEAAAAPPSVTAPSTVPGTTVSPSSALIADSTPSAGATTSSETLSVSSSTRTSSFLTASPTFLVHLAMEASATDSPRAGVRISAIFSVFSCLNLTCFLGQARRSGHGLGEEGLEFLQVSAHQARSGRGRGRTTDVARALGVHVQLLERQLEPRIDEGPAAHVLRLFLAPDEVGVGEARQFRRDRLDRPRIELFQTQDVDVVATGLLARVQQVVIDLARADDDLADVLVGLQRHARHVRTQLGVVAQHAVEGRTLGHVGQARHRLLVTQQRLGRHQDQRLAERTVRLATQDVEVVGRRRAVGVVHVVLGALLQEALKTRGGVLGALALIAVRQKHHQAAHAQPLALARGDELV